MEVVEEPAVRHVEGVDVFLHLVRQSSASIAADRLRAVGLFGRLNSVADLVADQVDGRRQGVVERRGGPLRLRLDVVVAGDVGRSVTELASGCDELIDGVLQRRPEEGSSPPVSSRRCPGSAS